jgi:nitroimidazol reductase NimA-like FMN-containing flavoprotein (pyridoxamine 5'-phosphate oxidase superfamily)
MKRMFEQMRRKDREITEGEAFEILSEASYCVIASIGENAYPSSTPFSHVVVLPEKKLYIHCARTGNFVSSIGKNPKVCVCAVGPTTVLPSEFSVNYESAMAYGTAYIADDTQARTALKLLCDKYSPGFEAQADEYIENSFDACLVIGINIEHITAKRRAT